MRKVSVFVLAIVSALVLSLTALAQDPTPLPAEPIEATIGEVSISDIVGNTDEYVGRTVTLEGNIIELVNVKTFVLDDGALLATNQVIVLNNTGYEYPLWVSADRRARVTGIVHPRTNDGGLNALVSRIEGGVTTMEPIMVTPTAEPMDEVEATPEGMEATPEMMEATATPAPMDTTMPATDRAFVNPLSLEVVPERLYDWVIIELVSIEDIIQVVE